MLHQPDTIIIFLAVMRQEMLHQPETISNFLMVIGQEHAAPTRHNYHLSCGNETGNAASTRHHYYLSGVILSFSWTVPFCTTSNPINVLPKFYISEFCSSF
jgi:hypothetical protein